MSKKYETIDEQLDKKFAKKIKKNNKRKEKKDKKGVISVITAAAVAFIAACGFAWYIIKNKSGNKYQDNMVKTKITNVVENTPDEKPALTGKKSVGIRNLGKKLELPSKEDANKPKYGAVVEGNIDPNKLVENNGTTWVNQEAADKSESVGNVTIDTNHMTTNDGEKVEVDLVVDTNGDVKLQESAYEIVDKDDQAIETGTGNTPAGYAWDDVFNGYVPVEEVGTYVICDKDYWGYDNDGKAVIVLYKGEPVKKSVLDRAKEVLYETRPEDLVIVTSDTNAQVAAGEEPKVDVTDDYSQDGVINEDGTFTTNYGLTFRSVEEYNQYKNNGYQGFNFSDGIMIPEDEIENELRVNNQKVLTLGRI